MEGGGFSGVFGVGKSLSVRESLCVSVCVSVSVRERESGRVGVILSIESSRYRDLFGMDAPLPPPPFFSSRV